MKLRDDSARSSMGDDGLGHSGAYHLHHGALRLLAGVHRLLCAGHDLSWDPLQRLLALHLQVTWVA